MARRGRDVGSNGFEYEAFMVFLTFGNPADLKGPVALRPHLAVSLPFSLTCSG